MTDNSNSDLEIIGKIATAIPQEGWNQLVATACDTFQKIVSPITATTFGVGRLIEAKFDSFVDIQKVMAAQNLANAQEKVKKSNKKQKTTPKAPIIIAALDESANQTDETIRQLWANLLAQELVSGNVHPEFTRILSRLSSSDARLLVEIAEGEKSTKGIITALINISVLSIASVTGVSVSKPRQSTFNHDFLLQLKLITPNEAGYQLTRTGWSFIEVVSDPSVE